MNRDREVIQLLIAGTAALFGAFVSAIHAETDLPLMLTGWLSGYLAAWLCKIRWGMR